MATTMGKNKKHIESFYAPKNCILRRRIGLELKVKTSNLVHWDLVAMKQQQIWDHMFILHSPLYTK